MITNIDVITIQPLVALILGILILITPRFLNYFIAIYLIFIGVTGLWPQLFANTADLFGEGLKITG